MCVSLNIFKMVCLRKLFFEFYSGFFGIQVLRQEARLKKYVVRFVFFFRFTPSFVRVGSWNIVMFMSYEQLKRILQNARDSGLPQAQVPQFSSEAPLKKFV